MSHDHAFMGVGIPQPLSPARPDEFRRESSHAVLQQRRAHPGRRIAALVAAVLVTATACGGRPVERVDLDGGTDEPAAPAPSAARIEGPCAEPAQLPEQAAGSAAGSAAEWAPMEPITATGCFELAAGSAPDAIDPALELLFTSEAELSADAVADLLVADPAVPLAVEALGESEGVLGFNVATETELAPGTPIRFTLFDSPAGRPLARWGFQIAAPLSVVSTHPGDETSDVPVDTGIELTFSHDGVTGAEDLFTIDPPLEGSFETHRRTLVFVPDEPLAAGTLYTVGLDSGATAGDAFMEVEHTFAFETALDDQEDSDDVLSLVRSVWQFPEGETPALTGYETTGRSTLEEVDVDVYGLADAEAFVASLHEVTDIPDWAWHTQNEARATTSGLPSIQSFTATVQRLDENQGNLLIPFPEELAPGYYLAEIAAGAGIEQAWLQVSDVGVYTAVSPSGTLLWVHDVQTGEPLQGAEVSTMDKRLGRTDGDGLLLEPAEDLVVTETLPWGTYYRPAGDLIIRADEGETVVPVGGAPGSEPVRGFFEFPGGPETAYWRFLYTDRTLYRPTDTVSFWGVARERGEPGPLDLEIAIRGGDYFGYDGAPLDVASTEVTTTEAGTYEGKLDFTGATTGFYTLEIRHEGVRLGSTGIEIKDFRTPAFGISVALEPAVAYADEPMTATATVTFFEGSPAPGIKLSFDPDPGQSQQSDASGVAVASYPRAAAGEPVRGNVEWRGVSARVDQSEAGDISAYAPRLVFAAAIALEVEDEPGDAAATRVLSGTVRTVDLEGTARDASVPPEDYMGEGAPDVDVLGEVVKVEWIQEQVGETYDFETKTVVPQYEYREQRTPAGTFTVRSDDDGRFTYPLELEDEAGFEVTVAAEDAQGRRVEVTHWVQTGVEAQPDEALIIRSQDDYVSPDGRLNYQTLHPGDPVRLRLERRGGELDADTPALFYEAAGGIRSADVPGGLEYEFEFDEEQVPNTNVVGVIFDGRTYDEVEAPFEAALDRELQRLTVEVTPAEEGYEPGGEAELEVLVTDAEGEPAEGAEVLLSAVDAAVIQAQGGDPAMDILGTLYQHISTGVVRSYSSHVPPAAMRGAEGGGGGDGRSDFKDTALFTTVTTDGSGRAQAVLPLPDNLTSWRVAAMAVTPDLEAGNGTGMVPVSLPVFVDLTAATSYVVDDAPDVRLRAFGTALAEGDDVDLALEAPTLPDAGGAVETEAFQPVWLSLGSLIEGRHAITASVAAGEFEDAVVQELGVLPSRLTAVSTEVMNLEPGAGSDIEGKPGRTLFVTDAGRGSYLAPLQSLANSSGDRADQALARHLAGRLLQDEFGSEVAPAPFHPTNYQSGSSGVALFPYGDADLEVSAWSAWADPAAYGSSGLIAYFTGIADDLESTAERQLLALQGLAALGQPVMGSLTAATAEDDLSPVEELAAAAGLAAAGDIQGAASIYERLVAEHGERLGSQMARLDIGSDEDARAQSTARAAAIGAAIGDPYAPLFFEYAQRNAPAELPVDLESIVYLRARLATAPVGASAVEIAIDGEVDEFELEPGETLRFTGFEEARVEALAGEVAAGVTDLVPVEPESGRRGSPTVTRTLSVEDGEGTTDGTLRVTEGDRVIVRLEVDLGADPVEGCYQVSDLLPTGLIAVTPAYDPAVYYEGNGDVTLPHTIDGQRVSFCVWESDEDAVIPSTGRPSKTLEYSARVLSTGTYPAEPALVQAMAAPELVGFSEAATVVIEPAVR